MGYGSLGVEDIPERAANSFGSWELGMTDRFVVARGTKTVPTGWLTQEEAPHEPARF
jgi:hypothetical protein